MAVTGAATIAEISDVVAMGEGVIRDFLFEEFTQGSPAIVDVVLQKTSRGHQAADLSNVFLVNLLGLVGEVTLEECLEELVKHWVVHTRGPTKVRHEFMFWITDTPVHGVSD